MNHTDNNNPVIDAVITWVDGNDPVHREKLNDWLSSAGMARKPFSSTRYNSIGEINYCVRSILKFAPFIRTIHIVTDNQVPQVFNDLSYLNEGELKKINLVDHKDIFKGYEDFLPTFNNRSIEIMIPRIKGLAEHFVYFNDDVILVNKIEITDLFNGGLPVIRGKWSTIPWKRPVKILAAKARLLVGHTGRADRAGYKQGQANSAVYVGFRRRYYRLHHTPAPVRLSTIGKFLEDNQGVTELNIKYRIRHPSQLNMQSLANHLEIKAGTAILKKDFRLMHMPSYNMPVWYLKLKLKMVRRGGKILFANFQSLELADKIKIEVVFNWLDNILQ